MIAVWVILPVLWVPVPITVRAAPARAPLADVRTWTA